MTETVVYVMRHAQAAVGEWRNRERPLAMEGWVEARRWAERLAGLGIGAVYSSPYRRALDSVAPFAAASGMRVQVREGVRESAAAEELPAVRARMVAAVRDIAAAHRGMTVLVCTHGGCLWGLMSHFAAEMQYEDYQQIGSPDLKRFVLGEKGWCWDVGVGRDGARCGTQVGGVLAFGQYIAGAPYRRRPGGYAVIRRRGEVAVVQTPTGYYLPGGGQDAGESAVAAVRREGLEECGMGLEVGRPIGRANEFTYAVEYGEYFCKECRFFEAVPDGTDSDPIEEDHELVWLPAAEAVGRLAQGSQAWALGQVLTMA